MRHGKEMRGVQNSGACGFVFFAVFTGVVGAHKRAASAQRSDLPSRESLCFFCVWVREKVISLPGVLAARPQRLACGRAFSTRAGATEVPQPPHEGIYPLLAGQCCPRPKFGHFWPFLAFFRRFFHSPRRPMSSRAQWGWKHARTSVFGARPREDMGWGLGWVCW